MERIAGLREYVAWKQYRSALGDADSATIAAKSNLELVK